MQSKEEKIRMLGWIFLLCLLFVLGFFSYGKTQYDKGYRDGQINYSLGKIRYTVIEGRMIHFFDVVNDKIKEE